MKDQDDKKDEQAKPQKKGKYTIAIDFSGTLAKHKDQTSDVFTPGEPVPEMIKIAKGFIEKGHKVRVFTTHADKPQNIKIIQDWCQKNIGTRLEVTNIKMNDMAQFWDDRAVRVKRNEGVPMHEVDSAMEDLKK